LKSKKENMSREVGKLQESALAVAGIRNEISPRIMLKSGSI